MINKWTYRELQLATSISQKVDYPTLLADLKQGVVVVHLQALLQGPGRELKLAVQVALSLIRLHTQNADEGRGHCPHPTTEFVVG